MSVPKAIAKSTRVLTRKQMREEHGIDVCNATLLRWESTSNFPKRFYLTQKNPVWLQHEVESWLVARSQDTQPNDITAAATGARLSEAVS